MTTGWRKRILDLIEATPGLTMKALSLRAGMSDTFVRDILKRDRSPSIDHFVAIANALGVPPMRLLYGDDRFRLKIPTVGIVSGGEGWTPYDGDTHPRETVDFDVDGSDVVALEVRGDSMSPVYRNGDRLICRRTHGSNVHNLIGAD